VHGRPIYHDVARRCGLDVKLYDNNDDTWKIVWQLYVRLNFVVSKSLAKIVESADESYGAEAMPTFADSEMKSESEK